MTENEIIEYIMETFKEGDHISIPIITRKLKINYNPAKRVFDTMVELGYVKRGPKPTSISTFIGFDFTDYDVEKAEGERIFNLTGTYPF